MHFLFTSSNYSITNLLAINKTLHTQLHIFGGGKESRTLDPLLAKQVL